MEGNCNRIRPGVALGRAAFRSAASTVLAAGGLALSAVVGLEAASPPPAAAAVTSWTAYAYNLNSGKATYFTNMNTATPAYGGAVTTGTASGTGASGTSISPDDAYAFLTDYSNNRVKVVNTSSNTVATTINGNGLFNPLDNAVSPDGTELWVADYGNNNISVFCVATGGCGATAQWGALKDITGSGLNGPIDVAITPNGQWAYVSNYLDSTVSIFCAATAGCGATAFGAAMPGVSPLCVTAASGNPCNTAITGVDWTSFTPDGKYAYSADCGNTSCATPGNLSLIQNPETTSPSVVTVTTTGVVGTNQVDIAPNCQPSACYAYVSNVNYGGGQGNIQVYGNVDAGVAPTLQKTVTAGLCNPNYFAITPDSKQLIFTDDGVSSACAGADSVGIFSTATNAVTSTFTNANIGNPWTVATMPDPAPTASYTVTPSAAAQSTYFDGSASTSPVGTIASYAWDFGNGCTATTTGAGTIKFAYASSTGGACVAPALVGAGTVTTFGGTVTSNSGTYTTTLTVTNSGGTSILLTYTGHTASNVGGTSAKSSHLVTLPTKLAVTASPTTGVTSATPNVGPITIQMQTSGGVAVNAPPAASGLTDTINLSAAPSAGATFYAWNGSACTGPAITSINVAAGSSSASVCFGDTTAAAYTLTFAGSSSASGLTSTTQAITLSPPGPYQIAFGTVAQSHLCLAPCGSGSSPDMGPITLQTEDAGGSPSTVGSNLTVNLASTSGTGIFSLYSAGVCQAALIASATISTGNSSVDVCYGDPTTGTPTITLTTAGLTLNTATQVETIAGPATKTVFTTAAESAVHVAVGGNPNMGPITISLEDASNRVTDAASNLTLTMSSSTPGGGTAYFSLWNGATCSTTKTTTFTIATGTSSVSVCYGYTAGDQTPTLTATVAGLTAGTQVETVSAGPPSKIVITSGPVSGPASSTPNIGPTTVTLEDAGGFAASATSDQSVTLTSTSGAGLFSAYSGGVCGTTLVTVVTIATGTYQTQVCYADTLAGSPTVTVTTTGLTTNSANQTETVTAAAPAVILITTASLTNVASATPNMGPITIALQDQYGNAATASPAKTVNLSSTSTNGKFSLYASGACQAGTITSTTVATSVSICYGDTSAGTPTVTVATTGLTVNSATQVENVQALSPNKLFITTAAFSGPPSATPNFGPIKAVIQDSLGNATNATSDETITLASTSGTGKFSLWLGTVCSSATITSTTIAMGSNTQSICYGDTASGTPTITLTASPALPGSSVASQVETVTAGAWLNVLYSNTVQRGLTGDFYGVTQDGSNVVAVGDDGLLGASYLNHDPGGADYGQVTYQVGTGNFNVTRLFDGFAIEQNSASVDTHSITSISCPTPAFCAAVDSSGGVMTYNGTSWSVVSAVDGANPFNSISCTSAVQCVAVDSVGNAFYFSGVSFLPTVGTGDANSLHVSCVSTTLCVAVDSTGNYLTFNQSTDTWSAVRVSGDAHILESVSCVLGSTTCFAVDNNGSALTSTNPAGGGAWTVTTGVDGTATFKTVSCTTTTACVAIDSAGKVFTYNGAAWSNTANTGKAISEVSCTSSSACGAVDTAGDVLFFDGTTWSPTSIAAVSANAISCSTSSFCMAGESSGKVDGVLNNGNTSGVTSGPLFGVACPSTTECFAVGQNVAHSQGEILKTSDPTNPNSWTSTAAPVGITELNAVSCPSVSVCYAVGAGGAVGTVNKSGALIQTTNGGATWSDVSASIATAVPGGTVTLMTGIYCVSTSECFAAGSGVSSGTSSGAMVYFNGTTWTVEVYETTGGQFTGIDCPSAAVCVASGQSGSYSTVYVDTNAQASPSSWSQLFSTSSMNGYLYGIGCTAVTNCYTVGWSSASGSFNGTATVAGGVVLNGNPAGPAAGWKVTENSNLGGGAAGTSVETVWFGIDCSAVSCEVVGDNNQSPYYPMGGNGS